VYYFGPEFAQRACVPHQRFRQKRIESFSTAGCGVAELWCIMQA
jgi:hypothetical protein